MYGWGVPAWDLASGAIIHLTPHYVNGRLHGHAEDVTVDSRERITPDLVRLYWHPSRGYLGSSSTERGVTIYERGTIVPQLGWEK